MTDRPTKITFAEMREQGVRGGMMLALCLMLGACLSDSVEVPRPIYTPPSPPSEATVLTGIKVAASEAKLAAPLEVSAVRPTDHGPGRYFVCLNGMLPAVASAAAPSTDNPAREPSFFYQPPPAPSSEPRVVYYSVFFDDVYRGSRPSVILDACEAQALTPIDLSPPPPAPQAPPKRKR